MGRGVRWGRGGGLGGSPCGWKGAVGTTLKKETPPPRMGKRGAVETTAKKRGVTEPPPPGWGRRGL